jgi:hypothetical protein
MTRTDYPSGLTGEVEGEGEGEGQNVFDDLRSFISSISSRVISVIADSLCSWRLKSLIFLGASDGSESMRCEN